MALMNLVPPPVIPRYAGFRKAEGVKGWTTASKTTYFLAEPVVFKRTGEFFDGEALMPNHTYRLVFGDFKIHPKFDIVLKVHPEIHDKAMVSAPAAYSGGYSGPLVVIVRPYEAIKLDELEYVVGFSIYE